jgi:CheY-like chemotaxis protein
VSRSNIILLVEDNPDDVELTLRAFRKSKVLNEIVVVQDGVEALDYVFSTGAFASRDPNASPEVVLLDLKLPKVDGLEILRWIRGDRPSRLSGAVRRARSTPSPLPDFAACAR